MEVEYSPAIERLRALNKAHRDSTRENKPKVIQRLTDEEMIATWLENNEIKVYEDKFTFLGHSKRDCTSSMGGSLI